MVERKVKIEITMKHYDTGRQQIRMSHTVDIGLEDHCTGENHCLDKFSEEILKVETRKILRTAIDWIAEGIDQEIDNFQKTFRRDLKSNIRLLSKSNHVLVEKGLKI